MNVKHFAKPNTDEQGMALITAILIMLISTIVVAGVLQLATHSAQRSGLSRNQTAARDAAEAGIEAELSTIASGTCPTTAGTETALPNQTVPPASYIIKVPVSCAVGGAAVVAATGYVPNATNPVYETTIVAHINRNLGAPVSGGANGGYDFPDALYADGTLTASSGLNVYGSGGSVPNITAGSVSIGGTGSLLGGAVAGQVLYGQSAGANGSVNVSAAQIGGQVTGSNVTLTGPMTLQSGVAASGNLTLTNVTVNGTGTYTGSYTQTGTTGTVSHGSVSLPLGRPLPTFTNTASSIGTILGVGSSANSVCPAAGAWTQGFYDISGSCPSGYAPTTYSTTASNEVQVIVVQGSFNVTIPPTSVGGQLYVIDVGAGSSDNLTITGSGSTLPIFAYSDNQVTVSGVLTGQIAGHNITVNSGTSLTFSPPAAPAPNFAFPTGYTAPTFTSSNGVSTISFQYACPGTTTC